jgi:hypothetical protein
VFGKSNVIVSDTPLWGIARFDNSQNVKMTTSAKFARGVYDGFQRFEKFARFALVRSPKLNNSSFGYALVT